MSLSAQSVEWWGEEEEATGREGERERGRERGRRELKHKAEVSGGDAAR